MNKQHSVEAQKRWQTVWQQHAGWLKTVLTARVRDPDVAEELLQEVALNAWSKRNQLDEPAKVGPWLYRIAIRQVLMFWRKRATENHRWNRLEADPTCTDVGTLDPFQWLVSDEAHQLVRDALSELPQQDREILMLKHTEGWTFGKIAEQLGITHDKVVYRLTRARQRLRKRLAMLEYDWKQK